MHIYFSGIGGAAIGPLSLIAHKAGFDVSGSDKQASLYIEYLAKHGVNDVHVGQTYEQMASVHARQPIDWFVYTSALPMENPDAPELQFCRDNNIKATKRDDFLNYLISEKNLKLIAIAGTHGKTTTTAMAIWLFKQLGEPISFSVGAKMSFADMGEYDAASKYFVYEADEFDRNFLAFSPYLSLITGIDWDHPDIYPTRQEYNEAFIQYLGQSEHNIMWLEDATILGQSASDKNTIIDSIDPLLRESTLPGIVNRKDAFLVASGISRLTSKSVQELLIMLNGFPGVTRRFERIIDNVYSDYAHTPPKISGALQLAHEVAGENVVVVYEGLHNTRQHFIKEELRDLFSGVKELYIVPSYLAREDQSLKLLTPSDLKNMMNEDIQSHTSPSELNEELATAIRDHANSGDLVLCLSAGGGGSLDEWLRKTFAA